MMRNRLIFALSALAGLFAADTLANPLVIVNPGPTQCTITPTDSTVFTLSTDGNVLINGSYTGGSCVTTGGTGGGDPTFTPFSPAPANLTIANSTLLPTGGTINPNFVVYYADSCIGKVTATAGCPAAPSPWGNGGQVCSAQTNTAGQKYCSPNSAAVNMPANNTAASCLYTFQAISCTNGTTSVNSQTANVTVQAQSSSGPCNTTDTSDIGYTRQCGGSATNYRGTVTWDNTYATLMNGAWPGNAAAVGHNWTVTVNAGSYAAFQIQTGTAATGVAFPTNNSGSGFTGLMSISTVPGDFFSGTAICVGSNQSISSKPGTVAQCKLNANSTYYMNISTASFFPPYTTTCTSSACSTAWGFQSYTN